MTHQLNRRQALAGFGTVSLGALLAACAGDDEGSSRQQTAAEASTAEGRGSLADLFDDTSSCTLTPEETEGPYYFDADAIRSDIREGREGVDLRLAIRVRDAERCDPLRNAVVDIWHCDALGSYSAVGETYMRGTQVTNSDGIVEFTTIYPGWYRGRTVHIHAKVHLDASTVLTTQLFFDDDVTAAVYERDPYSAYPGRDQLNDTDGLFEEALLLDLSTSGQGFLATISFDVAAT
jgi:protocatechuate 3,4-dioxygenase beta subunit